MKPFQMTGLLWSGSEISLRKESFAVIVRTGVYSGGLLYALTNSTCFNVISYAQGNQ